MKIYPSILTDSMTTLTNQVEAVKNVPHISTIQIDVIDGYFADNLTITPSDLYEVDFGELTIDFHLMTEEPLDFVYEFLEPKEELPVRAVIAQVEKMSHQLPFVEEVKSHQWKVGFSLDLFTPLSAIDQVLWSQLDIIQLMAVEAGHQDQAFKNQVIEKVTQLNQSGRVSDTTEVIVDGGVNLKTVHDLVTAGVSSIAVGSQLWNSTDLSETVEQLMNAEKPETAHEDTD